MRPNNNLEPVRDSIKVGTALVLGFDVFDDAAFEMLAKTYAEETKNTDISVAILDPGAMRTKMRAEAMPGEDPESLPPPDALMPMFFDALTAKTDGVLRFAFREWETKGD